MTSEDSPATHACCDGRKALIVEDDTLVGIGIKAHLEAIGFTVVGQAANTEQALTMFRAERPDVILIDIKLDDTDGIELARQLLAECHCAIVIVSAYSDAELISRASSAGVFGYL